MGLSHLFSLVKTFANIQTYFNPEYTGCSNKLESLEARRLGGHNNSLLQASWLPGLPAFKLIFS
jgi:hypothetical protein